MRRDEATALKKATRGAASRLPRVPLRRLAPLRRAQFTGRSPWWWSRRPEPGLGGRSDLAHPHGTVYFSTTALGALVEKLWDPGRADPDDPEAQPVDSATLRRLIVWRSSENPSGASVADLTDGSGGLPKEFCAAPYTVTQGWADEIHINGAGGLVHWLRLDPDDGKGVALFATGPGDGQAGFEHEAFPVREEGRGIDFEEKLPVQMFRVMDPPADDEIQRGSIDDIPPA